MDKLRAIQSFVAIADAGTLTQAARVLGSSLPAVVRLLAALEQELGARLFHRTTRSVTLTDAGRRYLERCRELLGSLADAEAELNAEQTEPRGKLIVTAPVLFGQRHVAAGITRFVQRYPKVSVDVLLFDRIINLVEEGIDVGIRIGVLDDSSLVAQHVGDMRRVAVAAPSYLESHGVPRHPSDLAHHDCIRFWRPGSITWSFIDGGKSVNVAVDGTLSINQSAAVAEACAAGLGIGLFFAYQVAPFISSGALRIILAEYEIPPRPIHIVYPEARLLPARARAFIDFMKIYLREERAAWQPVEPGQEAADEGEAAAVSAVLPVLEREEPTSVRRRDLTLEVRAPELGSAPDEPSGPAPRRPRAKKAAKKAARKKKRT